MSYFSKKDLKLLSRSKGYFNFNGAYSPPLKYTFCFLDVNVTTSPEDGRIFNLAVGPNSYFFNTYAPGNEEQDKPHKV